MSTDMGLVLFATVGGSHQPVVAAIRRLRPAKVVFICTDRDVATGRVGSRVQIDGKGNCILERPQDPSPTLPNIPTQCGLEPGSYEMCLVPADDLDEAYVLIRQALQANIAGPSEARIVADYTGGTKTMTAALVLAAMDHGGIDLQLMAGTRADLAKTRDGTQEVTPARVEAVRFERSMVLALAAWSRFAYDAAVIGFDAFPVPFDKTLRQRRQRARMLSIAFALWDRFDHAAAFEHLRDYQPVLRPALSSSLAALQIMSATASATPHEHQRREGVRIWDLWLNAQRRAVAGRYDDAIARAYRMIEWTAQWVLESRKGWRTAEVPEKVAVSAGMTLGRDGKYQAGLYQAWSLVADHTDTAAARFFRESRIPMLQNLEVRNLSILAHGFRPVAGREWETLWAWLRDSFEPMLREELADAGVRDPFPQLPTSLPEDPSPVAQSLP